MKYITPYKLQSSFKLQSSSSSDTSELTVDELANKIKVIAYGQNEDRYGLQISDRSFTDRLVGIKMSTKVWITLKVFFMCL